MLGLRSGIDKAKGPLMNVYDSGGKVAGTITLKRLTVLQTAFNHTQATAPSVMQELDATCFEHEVAKLLMRYQDEYTLHVDQHWLNTTLAQQLSTPVTAAAEYMHALKKGLSLKCERFALPLNFNPMFEEYYSMYEQDRVFGANVDAFSTKWEGASQASPEYTLNAWRKR